MTHVTYQATSLRGLVKKLLPSAESKNVSLSNWISMRLLNKPVSGSDEAEQVQHYLYGETVQPTFTLGISMPLSTDEVEAGEMGAYVNSRSLDTALGAFGQHLVDVRFCPDGPLMLTSRDDNDEPVKTLMVGASTDDLPVMDEGLSTDCSLPDMLMLLDALRSTVDVASVRGNSPLQQGVRIVLAPTYMKVESASNDITARTQYDEPWLQAPQHTHSVVLSIDAVRHLVAALTAYGSSKPLCFACSDEGVTIHTEGVCMDCHSC